MASVDQNVERRLADLKENAKRLFKAMHDGAPKERSEFGDADPLDRDTILKAFDRDAIRERLVAMDAIVRAEDGSNFEQVLLMRETAFLQQAQRAYLLRHRNFIQAVGQAAAQEELLSSAVSPAELSISRGLQRMLSGAGTKGSD